MRILHVNKFLYRRGGAEAYMEDLAALQEAQGDEVAYFGMAHPDNVHVAYGAHFPSLVELEPPPPSVAGRVRGATRMLWSSSARRGIDVVVEHFRPDVVHLHNVYHQLSPSILVPLARRGVPAVMTLHDYKLACPSYQFLAGGEICQACLGGRFHHAALRRCKDGSLAASALLGFESFLHARMGAYRSVARFICPSRFMADQMAAAGVGEGRLRHVPHFADLAGVTTKAAPGGDLVFAGRLSAEKGVDVLIDAMALLDETAILRIAGEGPMGDSLRERAAQRPAGGRVEFLGRLGRADLHDLIRASSVLVMPSRWFENQPMIILESLACGVPVVGTDLGGTPELIRPGVDGALVPANEPGALAGALRGLLADPAGAFAMGRAGRRRVEADFSPSAHLAAVSGVYQEAIDEVGRMGGAGGPKTAIPGRTSVSSGI